MVRSSMRPARRKAVFLAPAFLAAIAVALATGNARADWAFTHWGMTPEQVVGASHGSVRMIAEKERKRDDKDHWEISASGSYKEGDLSLNVTFMFDTRNGGLTCVLSSALGADVERLRTHLVANYGLPKTDDTYGSSRSIVWHTPDEVVMDITETRPSALVTYCAPEPGQPK